MHFEQLPKNKRILLFILLLIPLILSVSAIIYLKFFLWRTEVAPGEHYSPVENKPLLTGLIFFTLGYMFFLGMLFAENVMEYFNKRIHLYRR